MRREVSLYLDAARIGAALLVFLGHVDGLFGGFGKLGRHGQDAVAIFFVLSGFVIAFATMQREPSWASYAKARAARIYSVALLTIVLTAAVDGLGHLLAPEAYMATHVSLGQVFGSISFVGEIWNYHVYVGTNEPYWSLGFEVWYYALFGILLFIPSWPRYLAAALVLLGVGPRIAVYFPLWLGGALTYRMIGSARLRTLGWRSALALASCGFAIVLLAKQYCPPTQPIYGLESFGAERTMTWLYYNAIGIAFALTIVVVHLLAPAVGRFMVIEKPLRWIAGCSFTLYLAHLPILTFLTAMTPSLPWATRVAIVIGGTIAAVLLLAELGERRETWWSAALGGFWIGRDGLTGSRHAAIEARMVGRIGE